ncbi:MAG: LytTR family DNA-binding domain-containing protein [Spirochaetaceae bacterium]|nr:LytTR family DNA-binding domain-containing protein [Spirochaetaceae bacterium]MDE0220833.1 LytTR family DNA-binding domain-containing protein [Spirochaetaceae bacterium]
MALFVVALSLLGPLGTLNSMSLSRRLLYFGSVAFVMFPLCHSTAAVALYCTRFASLGGIVSFSALSALLQGLACTATVHAADTLLRPVADRQHLDTIFITVVPVLVLCSLFVHYISFQRVAAMSDNSGGARSLKEGGDRSAAYYAAGDGAQPKRHVPGPKEHPETAKTQERSGQRPGAKPASATQREQRPLTPGPERFYRRLSQTVSHDVIFLKVDDHYIDVFTTNGSCLILMRLTDALEDLGDIGLQTHRSYWVARRHMLRTEQHDGRTMVRVTGDHLVPVSRSYLPAVRNVLREQSEKSSS